MKNNPLLEIAEFGLELQMFDKFIKEYGENATEKDIDKFLDEHDAEIKEKLKRYKEKYKN